MDWRAARRIIEIELGGAWAKVISFSSSAMLICRDADQFELAARSSRHKIGYR
jgi:hypothetical protein